MIGGNLNGHVGNVGRGKRVHRNTKKEGRAEEEKITTEAALGNTGS